MFIRQVTAVDKVKVRVAGMIRHGAPVLRVFHAVNNGAVAAGGFPEATPGLPRGQGV